MILLSHPVLIDGLLLSSPTSIFDDFLFSSCSDASMILSFIFCATIYHLLTQECEVISHIDILNLDSDVSLVPS